MKEKFNRLNFNGFGKYKLKIKPLRPNTILIKIN